MSATDLGTGALRIDPNGYLSIYDPITDTWVATFTPQGIAAAGFTAVAKTNPNTGYLAAAATYGADYAGAVRIAGGRPWADVTHPLYGAKGDGVTNDGPAFNSAVTAVNVAGGGRVYAPAMALVYAISTTIVPKDEVTIFGDGVDATILKWTGAATNFLIGNSTVPVNPLKKFGVEGMTLDGNSTTGVTPLGLFTSQKGHFRDLQIQNVVGATVGALRLEALGTSAGQPGPLYSGCALNDFKNITFINCAYALSITGLLATAPCTLNHFYDTKMYQIHNLGIQLGVTCDTNYFFATDMIFDTNNATGIKINTGANRSIDNDAKLYLFSGLSITADPGGNTGFTAWDLGWTTGVEIHKFYIDPTFTTPTKFGGPAPRGYTVHDTTNYPNQMIYQDTQLILGAGSSHGTLVQAVNVPTWAATSLLDVSLANLFLLTVAGATTISFTNLTGMAGALVVVTIIQDGTGGRTVAWPAYCKHSWSDVGNTAGKRSTITFWNDGTNFNQVGAQTPYV